MSLGMGQLTIWNLMIKSTEILKLTYVTGSMHGGQTGLQDIALLRQKNGK